MLTTSLLQELIIKKKYPSHKKNVRTTQTLSEKKNWDFHLRELIDRSHFTYFGGLRSQPSLPGLSPTRHNPGNEVEVSVLDRVDCTSKPSVSTVSFL